MKSKNNLSITGVIVREVAVFPDHRSMRFMLAHNFGGGKMPLYLNCTVLKNEYDTISALHPRKGDAVSVTAYLRPVGRHVEAVIKTMTVDPVQEDRPFFSFDHRDTGRMYAIPKDGCVADGLKVDGEVLTLSTGERVAFRSEEGARMAWCLLDECFRKGYVHLFFEECTMSYGMD